MLGYVHWVCPDAEITCIYAAHRGASDWVGRCCSGATKSLCRPRPEIEALQSVDRVLRTLPPRMANRIRALRLDALLISHAHWDSRRGWEPPLRRDSSRARLVPHSKRRGDWIAFVSIGAGPIHKPISRWLMRSAGAVADYRSYRGTVAETLRERIGLNTRADATYPDLAFTLPSPRASRHQRPEGPLAVGVGVLTYVGWHDDAVDGRAIYQGYLTDRGENPASARPVLSCESASSTETRFWRRACFRVKLERTHHDRHQPLTERAG
jgi:hypothetical protein